MEEIKLAKSEMRSAYCGCAKVRLRGTGEVVKRYRESNSEEYKRKNTGTMSKGGGVGGISLAIVSVEHFRGQLTKKEVAFGGIERERHELDR